MDIEQDTEQEVVVNRIDRFRLILERTEKAYLEILRAVALVLATLILVWIAWLALASLYGILQDPDGVEVTQATVAATDLTELDMPAGEVEGQAEEAAKKNSDQFDAFTDNYFKLYQEKFEAFKQSDDAALTKEKFSEFYLLGMSPETLNDLANTADAMAADYSEDVEGRSIFFTEADYPLLLSTMREAADLPITKERLAKYRDTAKVRREDTVRRTRSERYCTYFSDYFNECFSYGTRSVPYSETIVTMVPPEGVLDHQELFAVYQDNFITKLVDRRERNALEADRERLERARANEEGWAGLSNALWFAGLFLTVMFFFLLVAMERHQRNIALRLEKEEGN